MTGILVPIPAAQANEFKVEVTEQSIPYEKLGPEHPIKHSAQLFLFETDLDDCGYCMQQVRYRVMENAFFVLLRFYLRVDGVRVRLIDTRIYHEFGSNEILREFKHLESDFDMLKMQGFAGGSEWMLSPTQADEVSRFLKEKCKVNEKITF